MSTSRSRTWLLISLIAFVGIVQATSTRAVDLPSSGMPVPELAVFDQTMKDFMAERDIEAGLLGIMKDGCIVYERGFGWMAEYQSGGALPENAMMRIASCGKPITKAAIYKLADMGVLDLGAPVFDLGRGVGGILTYVPWEDTVDERLGDITVQNLIDHRSGWDRGTDPTYKEIEIAEAMGVPSPPGRIRTARWAMNIPMDCAPGLPDCINPGNPAGCCDADQYSNFGYMLLGLILEQESGMDYIDFVRQYVFGPIPGERGTNIEVGKSFKDEQNPREPWYDDRTWKPNVFNPGGPYVFWPYGGWDQEARVAQGGLIADTETLLRFLEYYPGGHTGSLPAGTRALTRQRGDGINYVVLFNRRETDEFGGYCADWSRCMDDTDCTQSECEKSWANQVKIVLDGVIDTGGINWPTKCLDGTWVDFNYISSGTGNFDNPFNTVDAALANTPEQARMRIKGSSTSWAGTITQRVELHAPLGSATIGR